MTDREVVMIRYFGNKSYKEAAQTLGVSEDVARKRLSRAMEKLRVIFVRRGVAYRRWLWSRLLLLMAFKLRRWTWPHRSPGWQLPKGCDSQWLNFNPRERSIENYGLTKAKTAIIAGTVNNSRRRHGRGSDQDRPFGAKYA